MEYLYTFRGLLMASVNVVILIVTPTELPLKCHKLNLDLQMFYDYE